MNDFDRASKYVAAVPSVSEGGRNDALNSLAYALVERFDLSQNEFESLLSSWSSSCSPPLPDAEVRTTINSAWNGAKRNGAIGSKRKGIRHVYRGSDGPSVQSLTPRKPDAKKASVKRDYDLKKEPEIPMPMEDGTRKFILSAFSEGEGIGIAQETISEDGRHIPKDSGVVLERKDWLARLDKVDGDINKIFSSSNKTGAFIRINPLSVGGSKDSDVTAYRHALLEFDKLTIDEQWNLFKQSNIPCTAVIFSGKKSLHAWVKVDAKDRAEYNQRVQVLYTHFEGYIAKDEKGNDVDRVKGNRNPSRLSRLPGMIRGDKRQELIALNMGAESFSEWVAEMDAEGTGKVVTIEELLKFDATNDENSVIGDRWLCKGGSCLFVGPSGVGKSSLAMQLIISWGLGLNAFGMRPKKGLKSLIVQAENDLGDLAEMFKGVLETMSFSGGVDEVLRLLKENIVFVRETTRTGEEFTKLIHRLIDKHKPDLVWLDPLLSFIGDEISSQAVCSKFLRNWLNPISESTGVIWMMIHHTGKPPKDSRSRSNFTASDWAYEGIGSSELVNWARAVCVLAQHKDGAFELKLAKRGKRAAATDMAGNHTVSVWLRHAAKGIKWEQVEEPPPEEKKSKYSGGKEGKPGATFDVEGFIETIKNCGYFKVSQLAERAAEFSGLSEVTIYRKFISSIKSKMIFNSEDGLYHAK